MLTLVLGQINERLGLPYCLYNSITEGLSLTDNGKDTTVVVCIMGVIQELDSFFPTEAVTELLNNL
jgi:hypothetical protein